jgi:PUA domain protein
VQRHIRTGFCGQIPFLNLPAYSDTPKESKAPPAATEPKEEEAEEEVTKSSGKGGKKKGGGKKGGKNKGGKEEVDEAAQEGEEQQLAVIDEIWPKKDALGISKWLVAFVGRDARRADIDAIHSKDHINIYTLDGVPILWQHFDGPFIPSLKILHKCKPSLRSHSVTLRLTPPVCRPRDVAACTDR